MNEYIVRSGNGYVCEDRGLELPLMTSARDDALRHSFRDARDRILNMRELHGIECEACLLPLSNNDSTSRGTDNTTPDSKPAVRDGKKGMLP